MSGSLPATEPPPPLTGRDPSCEDAGDTSQPSPATQQVVLQHTPGERGGGWFLDKSKMEPTLPFFGWIQDSSVLPIQTHTICFIPQVHSFAHPLTDKTQSLYIKSTLLAPALPRLLPHHHCRPSYGLTRLEGGVIPLSTLLYPI